MKIKCKNPTQTPEKPHCLFTPCFSWTQRVEMYLLKTGNIQFEATYWVVIFCEIIFFKRNRFRKFEVIQNILF